MRRVIEPGDLIPDVGVWAEPGKAVTLRALARERPCFLFFYVLDWTHI